MVTAQLLAARAAGIAELVCHSLDDAGLDAFREGAVLAARFGEQGITTTLDDAARAITAHGFVWGASDGN
jgi:hypothetical protein